MKFEIKDRDAAGRICKFSTSHGTVQTPNLLPVINPNKMIITPSEMKKLFGTDIVITNSYIIKKDEKLRKKALESGVHDLIDFNGTIMTDSGTFQSYVYGDLELDYIDIVKFQQQIGSDIGTILDIFGTPDQTKKEAEESVQETIKRAKESVKFKKDMNLACTVQGSIYNDLRKNCAEELSKIEADFYPIGGVVPLMENQRYSDLFNVILSSKKGLNPSRPVHLFGCGHPMIFPIAVALGCDFFDSSAYIKYAKDERMIFHWGTEKLQDLTELPCSCPVCTKYDISDLKKLNKTQKTREIAKHNLYISYQEIKKIKNAIRQGSLWELVERRVNSNPYLLQALKILRKKENKVFLERYEPICKNKALFYTGSQTVHRPNVFRYQKRLIENYKTKNEITIILPEGKKPYTYGYKEEIKKIFKKNKHLNILIDSYVGPAPLELEEMYPIAQSVFSDITDKETEEHLDSIFEEFIKKYQVICWKGKETLQDIPTGEKTEIDFDHVKIKAVADMQFLSGAGEKLLKEDIKIIKSKKTKKIRNIYTKNKHILSMRASDGLFTLKKEGAKILHKTYKNPKLRIIVNKDAAPFIKDGKSVFAKFVIDADENLRPLDECLIVDENDTLLAVGRCLLNKEEMISFNYGMAAKTREII